MPSNPERISASEYEVRPASLETARDLVERHHYARGGSNTAVYVHGLFRKGEDDCLGVAWWLPPTRVAAEATFPEGDWRRVIALSRLVVVPGVPKNAASFLIGRSIRLIRQDGRFDCLVTYADEYRGHVGTIYRATNWEPLGLTQPQSVWVDPATGRMLSKKIGPRTRTADQMRNLGYREAGKFRKHKFRMRLNQPSQ